MNRKAQTKIITLSTIFGALTALCLFYGVKLRHPLLGCENDVYPMIVSAYTALLGFVIAASTILLTINTQPAKTRGSGMIVASADGFIEDVFENFILAKHILLFGVFLGLLGLVVDRVYIPTGVRAAFYALLIGNSAAVLWSMYEVIKILSLTGREILKNCRERDLKIMAANKGRTVDMPVVIPEELDT